MRILIGIRKMCMVIRHENMFFKDRRTEEQEGLLARIRQENRRTWGLLARGKTEEQKNMGLLARVRQKNRRTCSLVEGQNMFFCSHVFQKNMFFCSHVFQKIENKE